MKLLVHMLLLVGLFIHTNANSAETRGRVIKVFPQGIPVDVTTKNNEVTEMVGLKQSIIDKNLEADTELKAQASQVIINNEKKSNEATIPTPDEFESDTTSKKQEIEFELHSGLLKPQLNLLVSKYLPTHEVYWGNYEGKHEWYGNEVLKGDTLEDLLNQITSTYGKPPKGITWYIHRNVVEFIYINRRG